MSATVTSNTSSVATGNTTITTEITDGGNVIGRAETVFTVDNTSGSQTQGRHRMRTVVWLNDLDEATPFENMKAAVAGFLDHFGEVDDYLDGQIGG